MNFKISKQNFDLIIIGSGGAGLMAAISAINNGVKKIAVVSKVLPTNSHTVAAKGGINAALGNVTADDWKFHAYDTLKGSDYLADADAVEIMCSKASDAIIELEKMGVVFSRDSFGQIAQRAYGAQTTNFGKGEIAYRACYSKDKTGHAILHTLYQQALKNGVKFFAEVFVTDLLMSSNQECVGCLAYDLNEGQLILFESKVTILATGGYSQIYKNTTSSLICSGDGSALVLQEGLPLQDMEFVQFHPTGIFGYGFLITEAARGEGAYLLNAQYERFMKNYSPKMMELSSRDVISQAMATEIFEGKGCGENKNFLYLDLRHLSDEVLKNKLPGVIELVKNFTKLDVKRDLIPVAPSAHYTMGGIPTDVETQVLDDAKKVKGLLAIGEAACVSVHGANRLGCNSLLDLIVFGKISGHKAAQLLVENDFARINIAEIAQEKIKNFGEIFGDKNFISLAEIKKQLQENNEKNLGVFRNETLIKSGLSKIYELLQVFKNYKIKNKNLLLNQEIVEYFEVKNLLLNSLATNFSALNRRETRGAHYRSDFNLRGEELYHSLVRINGSELEFFTKEVRVKGHERGVGIANPDSNFI